NQYGLDLITNSTSRLAVLNNGNIGIGTQSPGTNKLQVVGTFTATTKNFTIDHPGDPENKFLVHSTVESDQYKNIYDGVARLDGAGNAVVELPAWFEQLNGDFRYQLTVVDETRFALVRISSRIHDGRFTISSNIPGIEVSWQVTGVRKDAYVQAHPLIVEQDKPAAQKGTYLHPVEHGQPTEMGVMHDANPVH